MRVVHFVNSFIFTLFLSMFYCFCFNIQLSDRSTFIPVRSRSLRHNNFVIVYTYQKIKFLLHIGIHVDGLFIEKEVQIQILNDLFSIFPKAP